MKDNFYQPTPEESLDPEDWEAARLLGHQMVDDMIEFMRTVRDRPIWRSVPEETRNALSSPTPREGAPLEKVYEDFKRHILAYPTGNLHPRFFGWVMGNGTVTGMLADMLASGMNPHLAGYDQSASIVERQVISWFAELFGFPENASGLLVSGGTMANMNGLAVARNEKAGFDIRNNGLNSSEAPRLRFYGSTQTHNWVYKCAELMGHGREAFHSTLANSDYQINLEACRQAIIGDISKGERPFCIVANAGTVNTGAIDDIAGLRMLADEFGLWLHVDGAFGSLAALHPETASLVEAQQNADSIAFDLHKWGYLPYDIGCVLVRKPHAHTATFEQKASYLTSQQRGLSVDTTYFADRGLQLSRSFRALKVWMSLKEQGVEKLGRLIRQNVLQARYLEKILKDHKNIETMAPTSLNIVCLR